MKHAVPCWIAAAALFALAALTFAIVRVVIGD